MGYVMSQFLNQWRPRRPSHPGETLRDALKDRCMSQADLCAKIKRPRKTICEVVNGKASITPRMALQLERALGICAEFWLARQGDYDLAGERRRLRKGSR